MISSKRLQSYGVPNCLNVFSLVLPKQGPLLLELFPKNLSLQVDAPPSTSPLWNAPFTMGGMPSPPPQPQISCTEQRNVQLFHQLKHFPSEPKRRYLMAPFAFPSHLCTHTSTGCIAANHLWCRPHPLTKGFLICNFSHDLPWSKYKWKSLNWHVIGKDGS